MPPFKDASTPPAAAVPKPYVAPALAALGTVGVVTAGSDDGTLDQLVGAAGGFQVDGTS